MKTPRASLTRRQFLTRTAGLGAAVVGFPTFIPASARGADGKVAPSNRITLATIGTGNQGTGDLRGLLKDERVQVLAIADVNRESAGYWNGGVAGRDPAQRMIEKYYAEQQPGGTYKGCAAYEDFREILARKDIDAVHIATPDHWHCLPAVMAAAIRARFPWFAARRCGCGCGRTVTGQQALATSACRKREQRRRDAGRRNWSGARHSGVGPVAAGLGLAAKN